MMNRLRALSSPRPPSAEQKVVYGVTVGTSAFALLRGQLDWLRTRGWDVHLVTTGDEQAHRAAAREQVTLHPVFMHRGISPRHDLAALLSWVRLLRRIRPAAVNVGTPKAGLVGGLAAWVCRVPRRVYVVRGLRLEGTSGLLHLVLWLMEKITIAVATDVVVVSESLGAEMRRRRLLRKGGAWLIGRGSSNGVPLQAITEQVAAVDRAADRDELGIAQDDFVVGYMGRLSADKGLDVLVDAVKLLPPDSRVRLLLIGSDESGRAEEWFRALGDRAIHVGWTNRPWPLYALMDALCLPTKREGFPNVVLEAAVAGIPTVTTMATGAIDSVVPGTTGELVPVGDARALAHVLGELAADPERSRRLGEAARRHVEENYASEHVWLGIESVLRGDPASNVKRI